ncbi:STAS/SEC14 domain-containing protein [Jannaschia sp. Os4]|uniref:STAS/SEC14 domain-containing protein n=1 Tax=Jannaschia sp. Os4 TaxID=2807617 RepID=UPI00193A3864|nr:STAS/SEC14 domain-containing protein [Jannaschia sp. Os4]MBM2576429.1 STAS/SEC14 domain-containing protein [Jannaschia sp. Os4]
MLTVTKPAPHRLDVTLRGALDAEGMRAGLDDLLEMAEGIVGGRMLYRIPEFAVPSLGALGVELSRLPRLLRLLDRFERCAVLSDSAWLRRVAEVEGALVPGLEIAAFPLEAEAEAVAWLDRRAAA